MTPVSGRPPINPERVFPTPCARSSRFGGASRLYGSILSVASRESRVSSDATIPKVTATRQTTGFVIAPHAGIANCCAHSAPLVGIGRATRCVGSIVHSGIRLGKSALSPTPRSTTASGAGRSFALAIGVAGHPKRMMSERAAMSAAPGWIAPNASATAEKVVASPPCWNDSFPIASVSYPTACGNCLRISTIPIAESIPLITDEGK